MPDNNFWKRKTATEINNQFKKIHSLCAETKQKVEENRGKIVTKLYSPLFFSGIKLF